jgi:hypothetical protein
MSGKKVCVILPISRSDFLLEATMSSLVRSFELFKPDHYLLMFSPHAEWVMERVRKTLNELKKARDFTVREERTAYDIKATEKTIDEEISRCEVVYSVVTPASNVMTILLTRKLLQRPNYYVVNFLFSFGSWHNFYYPYVPRTAEEPLVFNSQGVVNSWKDPTIPIPMIGLETNNSYVRTLSETVLKLNSQNRDPVPNYWFELRLDKCRLDSDFDDGALRSFTMCLKGVGAIDKKAKRFEELFNNLVNLAGTKEIKVNQGNNQEVELSRVLTQGRAIVDTNLVYYGIHTYEANNLLLPHCVLNEVILKATDDELFGHLVLQVALHLRETSGYLPTEFQQCDVVVPRADPYILDGAYLITADKLAYELWSSSPVSKIARVMLAGLRGVKGRKSDRAMALANLGVFLSYVLEKLSAEERPELCWEKSNNCVKVRWVQG